MVAAASQEILKPHLAIDGGHALSGTLRVSGAKNSALVLMTAALLTQEPVELCNVPAPVSYTHLTLPTKA